MLNVLILYTVRRMAQQHSAFIVMGHFGDIDKMVEENCTGCAKDSKSSSPVNWTIQGRCFSSICANCKLHLLPGIVWWNSFNAQVHTGPGLSNLTPSAHLLYWRPLNYKSYNKNCFHFNIHLNFRNTCLEKNFRKWNIKRN